MLHQQTIFESLEYELASERRRVVSDWRTPILLHQALNRIPEGERRWSAAPETVQESRALLQRLSSARRLTSYAEYPGLYRVTSAYALQTPIEEDEIIMELHPFAALSHYSALVFHQLTEDLPNQLHVSIPSSRSQSVLPVGTARADWTLVMSPIVGRKPLQIEGTEVVWHRLDKFFGFSEYSPKGYPVRVMTIEKTLIDGLAAPEWCGGLGNVFRAWASARDAFSLKKVLSFTEEAGVGLLRQRVGFVLETMGFSAPELNDWAANAQRGGSSKLLASAPFAPTFSERWKLSINSSTVPLDESYA